MCNLYVAYETFDTKRFIVGQLTVLLKSANHGCELWTTLLASTVPVSNTLITQATWILVKSSFLHH
jgi:hypothetical protein